jgi:hypothetical protein
MGVRWKRRFPKPDLSSDHFFRGIAGHSERRTPCPALPWTSMRSPSAPNFSTVVKSLKIKVDWANHNLRSACQVDRLHSDFSPLDISDRIWDPGSKKIVVNLLRSLSQSKALGKIIGNNTPPHRQGPGRSRATKSHPLRRVAARPTSDSRSNS